jgi:hypothetical protein
MGLYEPGVPAHWAAVKAQRRAPAHYMIAPVMLARCAGFRGPHGIIGMQGGLRRGACGAACVARYR